MIGGTLETAASSEVRNAPSSYPTGKGATFRGILKDFELHGIDGPGDNGWKLYAELTGRVGGAEQQSEQQPSTASQPRSPPRNDFSFLGSRSVRDTSEDWADYAERMRREGHWWN
jgi:hypothetical protein